MYPKLSNVYRCAWRPLKSCIALKCVCSSFTLLLSCSQQWTSVQIWQSWAGLHWQWCVLGPSPFWTLGGLWRCWWVWDHMASGGITWHYMGSHDISWDHMTPHGISWYHMGSHDARWDHIIPHGITWYHMGSHDTRWDHMIPHGITWHQMRSHDTRWGHMGSHGIRWDHLIPHGITSNDTRWGHMIPDRVTWYQMGSHDTRWGHMIPHGIAGPAHTVRLVQFWLHQLSVPKWAYLTMWACLMSYCESYF